MAEHSEPRTWWRKADRSTGHRYRCAHGRRYSRSNRVWRLQLMRFWRICRRRYAAEAAAGEGARLYGGRWNSWGVRVVYASTSLALAAMETFVNLEPNLRPADLVSIEGEIPELLEVDRLSANVLPEGWQETRDESLRRFGDDWIRTE